MLHIVPVPGPPFAKHYSLLGVAGGLPQGDGRESVEGREQRASQLGAPIRVAIFWLAWLQDVVDGSILMPGRGKEALTRLGL